QPAAIRATTSRCRGVIEDGLELMIAVMVGEPSLPRSSDPFTAGCIDRCISPSDGAGAAVAPAVRAADPAGAPEPEYGLADAERVLHRPAMDDVAESAQLLLR